MADQPDPSGDPEVEQAPTPGPLGLILSPLLWLCTLVLITGVRCYQMVVRPILPSVCRFTPSCSEYFIAAVRKYGPIRGAWRGCKRIGRCNPWHPGGYDPP